MSRWSPADLAEALSRNPRLRINRSERPVKAILPSEGVKRPERAAIAQNGVSAKSHSPKADYKAVLVQQCEIAGLKLEPEFRFHPERKFRADWKVSGSKVLIEYEGGLYSGGKRGHSSIAGIQRDIEKSNLAQILGFIVIRVAPKHVMSGAAFNWIMDALRRKGGT